MDLIDRQQLEALSIEELEQHSHQVNAEIQNMRAYAIDVQRIMGEKIESERVSKLLGKNVQVIQAKAIESQEAVGTPQS